MTRITGFVIAERVLKRMIFIIVRNRAGTVQVTVERQTELEPIAAAVTLGSAIAVEGEVVVNAAVKDGGQEMIPSSIDDVGPAEPELPIQEGSASELQLDWRFLALRRPRNQLVLEVQTTIERAMRSYWAERGFIELHSPKLMHSASESGSETFSTPYFDLGRAYLAQSPQFYKQMAMAGGLDRVFEIGPVFRAEPSMTPRHATEFTSVDVEMSWIESHEDVMRFEEAWLCHVLTAVRAEHGSRIEGEFGIEIHAPALPFPRLSLAEAQARLEEIGHVIPSVTKPGDIDPEGERLIASRLREEQGSEFVFITDYPASLRPFYHMRHPENPGLTRSFDLLWKGIEITTGAQREHRYPILRQQALDAGLGESVAYYLDFFRYGCPPHGGFGLGLARVVMLLLGLPSIREAVFLHRSPNRLTP
jgi:aspartyl/asparaginyl-tRNA synthetase